MTSHNLRHILLSTSMGLCVLLLSSCAEIPTASKEVASVTLTKVNSDRVVLRGVRFEQKNGRKLLRGYVYRHNPSDYEDTSKTHLTLTFLGVGAKPLLELPAEFSPKTIPHWARMPGFSTFSVLLDRLPEGIQCIQIRAYDDFVPIPTPPASAQTGASAR